MERNRNGNKINIVALSCGVFIPDNMKRKLTDWLSLIDTKALERAKNSNGINKNGCSIFYEPINDIIHGDKVIKCLKKGVLKGME